jgi:hypothetical protein
MRIDKRLNFIFPIDVEGAQWWVHSAPASRIVFETYFAALGRVFTDCFAGNDPKHVALAGPQLALPALKAAAKEAGTWDGPGGIEQGLVNELIRLTTVAFPGANGWEQLPLSTCIARDLLDDDTEGEIVSALVFFTAVSRAAPKALASTFLQAAGTLMDWRFSSSGFMEFLSSLPISKPSETTPTIPQSVLA